MERNEEDRLFRQLISLSERQHLTNERLIEMMGSLDRHIERLDTTLMAIKDLLARAQNRR